MMSPSNEFALHIVAGIPVITMPAEIDIKNADDLRVTLLSAAALGYATVVADLSATDFCDSAAMRELERGQNRAVAEGGEVRLVAPGERLLRLFDITGLRRSIRVYPTLAAALAEVPAIAIQPAGSGYSAEPPADSSNGLHNGTNK